MTKKLFRGLAASLCLMGGMAAQAGTFNDQFASGLDSTFWSLTTTTSGLYTVDATGGNVHIAKTGNSPGGFQAENVNFLLSAFGGSIPGDFSAKIDFNGAQISGNQINQVQLNAVFGGTTYFGDVFDNSNSVVNAHIWYNNAARGTVVLGTVTSGTLRIARAGNIVTGYFNGTSLFQESISTPLTHLWLSLQNNGTNNPIAVNFDDFSLTAAAVPEPSQWLMFAAGFGVFAAAAGRRRRRRV